MDLRLEGKIAVITGGSVGGYVFGWRRVREPATRAMIQVMAFCGLRVAEQPRLQQARATSHSAMARS